MGTPARKAAAVSDRKPPSVLEASMVSLAPLFTLPRSGHLGNSIARSVPGATSLKGLESHILSMSISSSSLLATVTDPLIEASIVMVIGYFAARYWLGRSSLAHFLTQLLVFSIFTGLMLT